MLYFHLMFCGFFGEWQNRDSQPLSPLTVKQIREAFQSSDDKTNFLIDGVDVNNVSFFLKKIKSSYVFF